MSPHALMAIDAKLRLKHIYKELEESDRILVRFIEDLIVLLVKKNVLERSEIPKVVIEGAIKRQKLRKELATLKVEFNIP